MLRLGTKIAELLARNEAGKQARRKAGQFVKAALVPQSGNKTQDIVVLRCAAVWRGLKQLLMLELRSTQITDAGCATLAAALNRGTLPALEEVICCVLFNFNSNW